ncbi:MAG TPA: hypothetical protein VGS58_14685, partial [Candidatus Sulfopaludibacter sp.]|nr:hypothetical protein [Candidatus Sulfopaludibacter sp.]
MKPIVVWVFLLRVAAAAPAVTKVEPPDWAVEPHGIRLRMLLTGSGLAGATVRCAFRTGTPVASAGGTHLFFDLTIPAAARPGRYPLQISTGEGAVEAPFALVPALDPAGRFQ